MRRNLPRCPAHLTPPAAREWRRVVKVLDGMGILTAVDVAALAAYCQAYGRWVEAEGRLREGPLLYRTPGGHVQPSPLLGIIHKQLELMGRYMVELGMTPAARSRVSAALPPAPPSYRSVRDLSDDELEAIALGSDRLALAAPAP
jgi:P27 family predicted phage terminase small subunit